MNTPPTEPFLRALAEPPERSYVDVLVSLYDGADEWMRDVIFGIMQRHLEQPL